MRAHWLDPDEQEQLMTLLLRYPGLLKFSNRGDLPLKMGGTTDIYLNERELRDHPEAGRKIVRLYSNALRRLDLDRFAEVPEAVSGIAGAISIETGLPYFTIREEAKQGRVTKGKIIGNPRYGDRVALIDDVITDGASKLVPYRECVKAGLNVTALVVLIDRQQGWREKFQAEGVNLPVWAGMTLHDVRKYLVARGLMQRCDAEIEAMNPIIVALDDRSWDEVLAIASKLRPMGFTLKANDLVFNLGIERLLPDLQVYGRVMVDLKNHDIPNTVANTCKHLRAHKPWAVTVHASGGGEMVKAAVNTLAGTGTNVLAITVLTSLKDECGDIFGGRTPLEEVLKLAEISHQAGAHGFVCSPQEARPLRDKYPDALIVTPGIQMPGAEKRDQVRTGTVAETIANGSSRVVIGRQILNAADPVAEAERILRDEVHAAC